jgi:hypothetical protein
MTTTSITTGQSCSVAIFNGHPGHVVGTVLNFNSNTPYSFTTVRTITMDAAGFDATTTANGGHPDSAICSKLSVRVRNISKAIDVAGVMRVMNIAAGVSITSPEDVANLINYVNDHPRQRTFGAAELRASRQFDSHPVDQALYHNFTSPSTTAAQWHDALKNPAMSTIVLVFPTIALNHYEITVNAHYYARYRVTGPLANMAMHPPTAQLSVLNKARDDAERMASDGYEVGKRVVKHAEKPFGEAMGAGLGAALFL